MTECQKIVFELLIELDRICRKNNIQYALGYGSALGILNFNGFIPWDDDADVIMTKENWNKFIIACKNDLDNNKFVLDCFENNPKYDIFIPAKLKRKNTFVKEEFISELFVSKTKDRGIYLDIQVITPTLDDTTYLKTMWQNCFRAFFNAPTRMFTKKKYKQRLKALEADYLANNINGTIYRQTPITGAGVFVEKNRNGVPVDDIFPFKEYTFEGKKFYSVNNLKNYCIILYGEDCVYPEKYPDKKKKTHIKKYIINKE